MGLASLCKNIDFTRDSGGPTCATTRAGINTSMQCVDPASPVTGLLGFVYEPESNTDPFFQLPLAFQPTVGSQYENPVGTGRMTKFPQTNFKEPQGAHAIQVSAGNKVFSAYSDLTKPLGPLSTMDPKAKTLNPYGMKPFGFNWVANTPVSAMEVCTPGYPSTGNGHTYQAQNAGITGAVSPVFTTGEGDEIIDNPGPNQIVWKEKTMVIANRLPPPAQPTLTFAGGGTFTNGSDIYIVITLLNSAGETLPSTPTLIYLQPFEVLHSVAVQIPALIALPGWIQSLSAAYIPTGANVYVAVVPHGQPAPALSTYQMFANNQPLGGSVIVTGIVTGSAPPTMCSARVTPGQLPTPVVQPQIQRSPSGGFLNPPAAPVLSLSDTPGFYGPGSHFFVVLTLVNANGETTPGPQATIVVTSGLHDIDVLLAQNYGPSVTGVNIYAGLTSGGPPVGYNLVNPAPVAPGSTFVISNNIIFPPVYPPTVNTAALPQGSFPDGRDIYVAMTYTNQGFSGGLPGGETPLGPANSIINTNPDDAVLVTIAAPLGPNNIQLYSITSIGIYEADVPTGDPAPPASAFALVGYFWPPGVQEFILNTANGPNPPMTNTTGPGGAIAMDTTTGGANGGQGYRYAAMGWINQMETFSGFSEASVVQTIIDEDGWEIGAFNVLTGPPNVVGRYIAFTVADSSQAGPFAYIGLVDLQVPSQNVVYPTRVLIDQVEQSATVFLDNVTTQGVFNFTDTYLIGEESGYGNNVDDRLDIAIPPQGVRIDYLESVDRVAISGIPGYATGCWISLGADYESFYSDSSPVPITTNGERCYGVTDKYKSIIFALCEESGFTIEANTGNPDSWTAKRRWGGSQPGEGMGPCGFRAWDACGKYIIFAHRSGIYKYDMSDPDLMTKEVPRAWSQINWAAGSTISVTIDEDTHTVRALVPTGQSTSPNLEISLSYIEGWNNPIHFSTFSGREISMDAARRYAFNDVSAFLCLRLKRTLPPGGNAYLDGPSWTTLPDSSFQLTQLLYASSAPDGTVQARTPGVFSDNGGGIDSQYETMSSSMMQAVCKAEGFNLNAAGNGMLIASFLGSRVMVSDQGGEQKLIQMMEELQCAPIPLSPKQLIGITRKVPPSVNEFWRLRFTNGKVAGSWFSLKAMTVYFILFTVGRDIGDR